MLNEEAMEEEEVEEEIEEEESIDEEDDFYEASSASFCHEFVSDTTMEVSVVNQLTLPVTRPAKRNRRHFKKETYNRRGRKTLSRD